MWLVLTKCWFSQTEHLSAEWPCLTESKVQSSLFVSPSVAEMAGEGSPVDSVQGAGSREEGNEV